MSQYTYSFLRSEYTRIPLELKEDLDTIISESKVDPDIKELFEKVLAKVENAINDLAKYGQDQLVL
jgi:hypothetical protein